MSPGETFVEGQKTGAGFCSVPDGDIKGQVGGAQSMDCPFRGSIGDGNLRV